MADRDFLYLAKRLDKIAVAVERDVQAFVNLIAQDVVRNVAGGTPVDTGRARSNWVTRIGQPTVLLRKPYFPYLSRTAGGAGGDISEGRNLQAAVAQANAALARRRGDQPIYITNNAPYIARLNRGYSRQAPSGFVQTGIKRGIAQAVMSFKFTNTRKA